MNNPHGKNTFVNTSRKVIAQKIRYLPGLKRVQIKNILDGYLYGFQNNDAPTKAEFLKNRPD